MRLHSCDCIHEPDAFGELVNVLAEVLVVAMLVMVVVVVVTVVLASRTVAVRAQVQSPALFCSALL